MGRDEMAGFVHGSGLTGDQRVQGSRRPGGGVAGFRLDGRRGEIMFLQGHPMLLLIEMVTGVMQNHRERHRRQKEKGDERRQKRGQDGKLEQFAIAEGDGDGSLEKLPALFEFRNHRVEGFFSLMKLNSSLSVRPLLAASANSR